MAESKEELKSFLIKMKEESEKVGLKLNIQKTKIMASDPITLRQTDGETRETVADLFLGDPKITADQRADTLKPYAQETSQSNHTRTTALSNSMKLSHAHGATQDRRVMVKRSDKMWSTGQGNGRPLQYSCLENPMNSMKRQNDGILKEELPRSVGAQYATGDQWRNNSKKNEGMEPKQKEYPAVDVTGDKSKV